MQITGNAVVWKLYSDLYQDGDSNEERDKVQSVVCNTYSSFLSILIMFRTVFAVLSKSKRSEYTKSRLGEM